MKRVFLLMSVFVMVLGFSGCFSQEGITEKTAEKATQGYQLATPEKVAAPLLPPNATFTTGSYITIPVVAGTKVRYTRFGETPSSTVGTELSVTSAVFIPGTRTIKAIAYKAGAIDSDISSAVYTITPLMTKTAAPVLPPSATFTTGSYITIPVVAGTKVRYTRFGETPSSTVGTELLVTSAVFIPGTRTIKAIAYKTGMAESDISSAVYTISPTITKIAAPILPPTATYLNTVSVTIPVIAGTKVRYTINGTTPSQTNGTEITVNTIIKITATTTLKAIAYKTGALDSAVSTSIYTINNTANKVAAPVLSSSDSVTVDGPFDFTIPVISGTKVRYTRMSDGYLPTSTKGTEITVSTKIRIANNDLIRAIAYKDGYLDSSVSQVYFKLLKFATPQFSLASGTYLGEQILTISSESAGYKIYYTTDGSDPTQYAGDSVFVYSGPIKIRSSQTIKAVVYNVYDDKNSDVAIATYKIIPTQSYSDGAVIKYITSAKQNAVNIVFLGDGFVKDDLGVNGSYENIAKEKIDSIFSVEPFKSYKENFNAYIVCAESKQQGVDTSPELNDKDTIFNMTYNYNGAARALVVQDEGKVYQYSEKAVPLNKANIIVVCANDYRFGGTGGTFATLSLSRRAERIIIHEIGHSFGNLGDEYVDSQQAAYFGMGEIPYKPNVDTTNDLTKIKWKKFIGLPQYANVGAFEGGFYRDTGVWRPEETSIMQTQEVGYFNAPSREAIVQAICAVTQVPYSFNEFLIKDKAVAEEVLALSGTLKRSSVKKEKELMPLNAYYRDGKIILE